METSCDSKNGITVGIVDTMINCLHLLKERGLSNQEVQEALKDFAMNETLLLILHGDVFVGKNKPKERRYKADTILTDGTGFIYLRWLYKKDWTPSNNYGRKHDEYTDCTFYPNPLIVNGEYSFVNGFKGKVTGMWLQEGDSLQNFRPIDKKLIHPEILADLIK
jgi:hypothetical protein